MATTKVVTHKSNWTFNATGQAEGEANSSITGDEAPVFGTIRPWIRSIKVKTIGTGGAVIIREKASGLKIVDIPLMDTNTLYEEVFDSFFDGIYIDTLPAAAVVTVKHGMASDV